MGKPNLFNYATSELSQDAFICWMLSWADPEAIPFDRDLYELSHRLLQALFAKHKKEFPPKIEKLEVRRQHKNIDILVIINGTIAIPIEDKLQSREHSDQLSRYLKILKDDKGKEFAEEHLLPIYLQTGEQGDYKKVTEAGYLPFLRMELLNVLRSAAHIKNNILKDYLDFLEEREKQVQSFKRLHLSKWASNSWTWTGFYNYLQKELKDGEWGYVSNASKGFLGFWWHWKNDNECKQYLQLEETKLCFKIEVKDKAKQAGLKYKWSDLILKAAENTKIRVIKPVLRNGLTMTVAVADSDYRQADNEDKIDLTKTVSILQEAQKILDKAVNA